MPIQKEKSHIEKVTGFIDYEVLEKMLRELYDLPNNATFDWGSDCVEIYAEQIVETFVAEEVKGS